MDDAALGLRNLLGQVVRLRPIAHIRGQERSITGNVRKLLDVLLNNEGIEETAPTTVALAREAPVARAELRKQDARFEGEQGTLLRRRRKRSG